MRIIIAGILIWCNSQWAGVALLRPYRSWWVEYSYGQTWNSKGETINLWHFPVLGHTDTRKLLKAGK